MADKLWPVMDRQERISMLSLRSADIPTSAGVYALYRHGERVYVGKAGNLHGRVWKNHSGRGRRMGTSALRRNIAEHLGIATAADIKAKRYPVTTEEAARVRAWLDECEITWRECPDAAAAKQLEDAMKAEHLPPLTKT
jgi:hypothetical protein